ncbi:MAG TPA: riboflavin synthase [Pirellulales bacterium]|jgi:riboflavin synthase|nr:riboflavin synthase [Pirellulales bacterium]
MAAETNIQGMFTGIVRQLAPVAEVVSQGPGNRLVVEAGSLATAAAIGDSVAMNGCCLTVVDTQGGRWSFDAGPETLARTNLGRLQAGSLVNLEPALRVGEPLGGHWVTGHVDCTAALATRQDDRDWSTFWFALEPRWTAQMVPKGSVTVDGVSLTLVDVAADRFSVALIPHTLAATTLGRLAVGERVNIETDVLAKYVEKCLAASGGKPASTA